MEKISWTGRVRNELILKTVKEKMNIIKKNTMKEG